MDIILQSISNLYTDTPLYTGLCSCVLVAGFLVRESWRVSCGKWISLLCCFHSSYSWKLARDKYHREWQWWVSELFKNKASLCCDWATNSEREPFQVCPVTKFLTKEEKAMQHHWNLGNEFTVLPQAYSAGCLGGRGKGTAGSRPIWGKLAGRFIKTFP